MLEFLDRLFQCQGIYRIPKFTAPAQHWMSFVKQPCSFLWRCTANIARNLPGPLAEHTLSETRWRAESTKVICIHQMDHCLISKHAAAVPGVQLYWRFFSLAIRKDQVEAKSKEWTLESDVSVQVSRGAECSWRNCLSLCICDLLCFVLLVDL